MNPPSDLQKRWLFQDQLNFWLTNRIPRAWLTRLMGRFSKIRHPWISEPSIRLWQRFSDLDLREAESETFDSLHDCFVRRLKPGSRSFSQDENTLCSPCDAIAGTRGTVTGDTLVQAKGMVYSLSELMGSASEAHRCEGYHYVTLRLTATMYHHFHAPHNMRITGLRYIHGDVWNVNPPTLQRIPGLFAKNERAILQASLEPLNETIWMIPVAAVLVASMRFTFSDIHLHLDYAGPTEVSLDVTVPKGEDLGWFEHGSTIICLIAPQWQWVGPPEGERVKAGDVLWQRNAT